MKIIVGHTNLDLDCIGSMVLARHLHPDHELVRSHLIHPVARNLYNLYEKQLRFAEARDLKSHSLEHMVVVDTRSYAKVREYLDFAPDFHGPIEIYDHHPADSADLDAISVHDGTCGANTTLVGLELMRRGIRVPHDDATIALIGIYADTGRFTHTNVQSIDFDVASYLMECGASLKIMDHLLRTLRDEAQVDQFHKMLNNLVHRNINGHSVQLCYLQLERQVPGLAAVVEKVFEAEGPDALFAVFGFEKQNRSLIIARTGKEGIDLSTLLAPYGGGGHAQASSALVKDEVGEHLLRTLGSYLDVTLAPAVTAAEIMSREIETIKDSWDLMRASIFLEEISHTGAPVVNDQGTLVGFMTLRDIMKARKAGQMHAPVRGYMTRRVVTAAPEDTISQIERLMFTNGVGHVPVVDGWGLSGMVTRTDFLRFVEAHQEGNRRAFEETVSGAGSASGKGK